MTEPTEKDYYELLGVDRNATEEQIKLAYRDIARVYHPDSKYYAEILDVPLTKKDEEIFKLVTAAYDTLMDAEKRAQYDKTLLKGVRGWNEEQEEFAVNKLVRPVAPRGWEPPPTPKPPEQRAPSQPRGFGAGKREEYVSVSSVQHTRPVADLLQSTRRSIVEKLLLFVGLGLPLLTLAGAAIYLFTRHKR